jgi:hypothetical protein
MWPLVEGDWGHVWWWEIGKGLMGYGLWGCIRLRWKGVEAETEKRNKRDNEGLVVF